ncbi:MAG: hypothetical protein R3A11_03000 [Bdellovibrionota bacterium]
MKTNLRVIAMGLSFCVSLGLFSKNAPCQSNSNEKDAAALNIQFRYQPDAGYVPQKGFPHLSDMNVMVVAPQEIRSNTPLLIVNKGFYTTVGYSGYYNQIHRAAANGFLVIVPIYPPDPSYGTMKDALQSGELSHYNSRHWANQTIAAIKNTTLSSGKSLNDFLMDKRHPLFVYGHSFGASIALSMAQHPELSNHLHRLIIEGPLPPRQVVNLDYDESDSEKKKQKNTFATDEFDFCDLSSFENTSVAIVVFEHDQIQKTNHGLENTLACLEGNNIGVVTFHEFEDRNGQILRADHFSSMNWGPDGDPRKGLSKTLGNITDKQAKKLLHGQKPKIESNQMDEVYSQFFFNTLLNSSRMSLDSKVDSYNGQTVFEVRKL